MSHIDYSIFQIINHFAISERFLNPLMIFLAEKAEYLFFAGIIFYWFYHKSQNRKMVVEVILAASVALSINGEIGHFFYRNRPFVTHHVNWLIPHVKNASFPSDHATAAFVIATSIWIWKKRDGWMWLVLAAGIALSRVWTGVHYPLDVAAGMLIGASVACAIHFLLVRFEEINKVILWLIEYYEKIESNLLKKNRLVRKR
ncbi:undecaprenyl-diphosphatase [Bacillus sp. ISL-40]|uniref:undecaprenyl-diphosphatase n=1 Tax=unclassified Bacillus (in: firmicutes) TaxID=185979 RepID=UPI001BEAD427|nr:MULTISPECIES: undecaprenyl-diphosphatase [unclassified Bacillus (in: firmicutes)]MBT2698166.1 undecaprenyl-diphosphatase [Bacillus sp. ISL-40]MBT2742012.1 undecaprenyl-diphosphatase [Bacillus sp. ISL-77]